MQFPKKLPDMPKGNWKSALAFPPTGTVKLPPKDQTHDSEAKKSVKTAKPKKPIAKISEKKKKRIKEQGSEADLFKKIWNERPHQCEKCGYVLKEPKPHNFDHKISKSRGEEYRLDATNIQILCFSCHFEKSFGLKYKGIDLD